MMRTIARSSRRSGRCGYTQLVWTQTAREVLAKYLDGIERIIESESDKAQLIDNLEPWTTETVPTA